MELPTFTRYQCKRCQFHENVLVNIKFQEVGHQKTKFKWETINLRGHDFLWCARCVFVNFGKAFMDEVEAQKVVNMIKGNEKVDSGVPKKTPIEVLTL